MAQVIKLDKAKHAKTNCSSHIVQSVWDAGTTCSSPLVTRIISDQKGSIELRISLPLYRYEAMSVSCVGSRNKIYIFNCRHI